MKQLYKVFFAGASALFLSLPALASAHEVYVLTPAEITKDTTEPAFPFMDVVMSDMHHFVFWGFITALVIVLVFLISISRKLENIFDPFFMRMRKYAPLICRVTVGIAFLAAAYNSAAYGPELPLVNTWGMYTIVVRGVLVCLGILTIFGVWVRAAAIVALGLYAVNVYFHGFYMLTYTNYLGEVLILLLVGTHEKSVGRAKGFVARTTKFFEPYSFLILRVCFGVSLFYASFYAKFLHNNLALDVASGNGFLASIPMHAHTVAYYLGFEPHFLVLGACIVEFIIALFFIFGIEIRFTSLFLEIWLALSLWYFGETVWPHLILIGIPIAFIFYGYDKYSLEGMVFKDPKRQPML